MGSRVAVKSTPITMWMTHIDLMVLFIVPIGTRYELMLMSPLTKANTHSAATGLTVHRCGEHYVGECRVRDEGHVFIVAQVDRRSLYRQTLKHHYYGCYTTRRISSTSGLLESSYDYTYIQADGCRTDVL
jgi:hypothetical protein